MCPRVPFSLPSAAWRSWHSPVLAHRPLVRLAHPYEMRTFRRHRESPFLSRSAHIEHGDSDGLVR
jgi:hypothetical protein